jgi:hypothetical protein
VLARIIEYPFRGVRERWEDRVVLEYVRIRTGALETQERGELQMAISNKLEYCMLIQLISFVIAIEIAVKSCKT